MEMEKKIDIYSLDSEEENAIIKDGKIDLNHFYQDYKKLKSNYKTRPYLNKYERTRIISERAQQLANGAVSHLKNPQSYSSVHDIAIEELKQNKIPFILRRNISENDFELWKIEDLES